MWGRNCFSFPDFSGVRDAQSFIFCVVVVILSFLFLLLCCLSFFDLRIPITPLVSSNLSCKIIYKQMLSQNDKYNFLSTNRDFVKIIKDFLQTEVDIFL